MRPRWSLLTSLALTAFSASGASPIRPAPSARAGLLDASFGMNGMARISFVPDDAGGFFGLDVVGDAIIAAGWGMGGLGAMIFGLRRRDKVA